MKSIYESASSILEQNKMSQGNRSLPPLEGHGGGGTFSLGGTGSKVPGTLRVGTPEKPPVKSADNFVPSATRDGKPYDSNLLTGKALEKVLSAPPAKSVPATERPAVFKTNPDRVAKQKAKELEVRMDQMQQQGIGQTKPKVSSDYYKNLKAAGMKTSNESRMSSAYSTIRRILGEVAYGTSPEDELKLLKKNKAKTDPKNLKKVLDREKQLEQEIADKNKTKVPKPQASNTPSKDLEAKGLRGNEEMKKQEDAATRKEKTSRSMDNDVSRSDPLKPLVPGNSKSLGPVANVVVPSNKETDKSGPAAKPRSMQSDSGPDVEKMKQGIASSNKPVQYGLDQKDANDPLEAKRAAEKAAEKAAEIDTVKATKDNADAEKPVESPASSSKDPSKMNQSNPNSAYTSAVGPATNGDSKVLPQAAMTAPSSEFKFSDEQEKWLGKANRQDPYILNRMPGDKPPVDYYKDPKDQELAKKINTGNDTVKKIKGAMGMKESTINNKFNITDALYQSVMEVMKKDKGSVPRNEKEKDLAAFHGDPKRITHGDVLKARGVTREEAELEENTFKYHMDKAIAADKNGDTKKKADHLANATTAKHAFKAADYNDSGNKKLFDTHRKMIMSEEESEFSEALVGNQHEIDANKNNKIDAHDFKLLRAKKKNNQDPVKEGVMARVLPILTGGSDKDQLKRLQKDMGVPQTGQKPTPPAPVKPMKENKDTPGNSYEHQCAVHVKSESFGEGRTITTQHASPDADGNIEWYDVMFEHGIERYVPTNTLEILVSEMHMHSKKKKKMM